MAARKKRGDGNGNGMSRAVGVLIENMQGQFEAFGERLQGMDERMQGMDERMTAGFARVDERMDRMEVDLGLVKTAVLDNSRVLQEHGRLLSGRLLPA